MGEPTRLARVGPAITPALLEKDTMKNKLKSVRKGRKWQEKGRAPDTKAAIMMASVTLWERLFEVESRLRALESWRQICEELALTDERVDAVEETLRQHAQQVTEVRS
jgi:hypothetical protein